MNFFTLQTINTYTKTMQMQMKWQQKRETKNFTADGSTGILDSVREQAEEIRRSNADGSTDLSAKITLKLSCGKRLTAEEMEYLRKNDPETYRKAKAIEAAQDSYEKELKHCKTKEEVQRVQTMHTAASLSAVNSIKNNPAIPEGQKLGLIMYEMRKNAALQETMREFVKSGGYAKLPTEEEQRKAEEELQEAKEAEMGVENSARETPEEIADRADEPKADAETDTESPDIEKTAEEEPSTREGRRMKKAPDKRKLTRAEAETTPEAMKVKRAKAQSAYQPVKMESTSGQILDVKVH